MKKRFSEEQIIGEGGRDGPEASRPVPQARHLGGGLLPLEGEVWRDDRVTRSR